MMIANNKIKNSYVYRISIYPYIQVHIYVRAGILTGIPINSALTQIRLYYNSQPPQ